MWANDLTTSALALLHNIKTNRKFDKCKCKQQINRRYCSEGRGGKSSK